MISISILSIKEDINKIKEIDRLGADYIHYDIMDNEFVPNLSDLSELPLLNTKKDVHLMVYDIKKYIDIYKEIKPEFITFHVEATDNIQYYIDYIKSLNIKVGLSINPDTSIELLNPYLDQLDLILIMSVQPGFGGQKFIESSKEKLDALKVIRDINNYNYVIEVDGGVNIDTKEYCDSADILVVGSYITSSDDYINRFNLMK